MVAKFIDPSILFLVSKRIIDNDTPIKGGLIADPERVYVYLSQSPRRVQRIKV